MPKHINSWAGTPLGSAPKYWVRVNKDQGPALDRVLRPLESSSWALVTSRTGSKNGQHAMVHTHQAKRLYVLLQNIPGFEFGDVFRGPLTKEQL